MRKALWVLVFLMALPGTTGFRAAPQAAQHSVNLYDRSGKNTFSIVDGNQIEIEIELAKDASESGEIDFRLDDEATSLGKCTIETGKNTCRTRPMAALGWHWASNGLAPQTRTIRAFDAQGEAVGKSEPIQIMPRPVVLVHGFISSWETWKPYLGPDGFLARVGVDGFALGDGRAPGTLNTGVITNPAGRTNTIAQNAEILGQYITGVKQKTGAEMVDLVVHSMGGMISRYYIDRVMRERDVAQLIMLGSPMGGSDCSVLPASLGFYLPASLEIRTSYMLGIFNRQITHRQGVQFYDLGGTPISEAYQSPCTDTPNDTVVSFGSINAIPLESSKTGTIHSELTLSPAVFDEFVRPRLQKTAGSFAPAEDTGSPAANSAPLQFTRVYRGHVEPGGSQELTINIEANLAVASFAMYDPTRSTEVSVRGASGNIIELDPQRNGFIRVDDPSSMLYLGYGFQNPKPGPWKVKVLATDQTPASGADFAISVYFSGGATLQATSDTLIPQPGQQVSFSANMTLGGLPLEIGKGQVTVRGTDGAIETLEMKTGTQASAAWKAREPGVYGADVEVSAQAPDGTAVERTSFLTLEVQANPSRQKITASLAAVAGGAVLFVGLILFLAFRAIRFVFRQRS